MSKQATSTETARVLRRAARLMERGESHFTCEAISSALGNGRTFRSGVHHEYVACYGKRKEGHLQDAIIDAAADDEVFRQHLRVMLLCMAAAVIERP